MTLLRPVLLLPITQGHGPGRHSNRRIDVIESDTALLGWLDSVVEELSDNDRIHEAENLKRELGTFLLMQGFKATYDEEQRVYVLVPIQV